ncbi:MAG: PLP-dependent aminotransferase family protein, partial [Acidobacteriota bacterium]
VKLMEMRGVRCRPQNIFLTAGAQQGMDLVARLLLDPEGPMMLEDIVYEGMQTVTKTLRPQLLTVPTSAQHGMDVDAVELALASGQKPAFIYAITDGHNPLGGSLPMASRWRLVELARRYGVPILEDDAYGYLYYDDQPAPPMRAINDEWVFYLGSFSKILAPALRVGWLVVPEVLQTKLAALKQASDIDVANYSQRTIATYLDTGVLPRHLDRVRAVYRTRRDAMLDALTRHFPAGCRWNTPSAGLYLWVELPEQIDALELLRRSIEAEKIAFTPGKAFALRGRHHANHCMRLAFGNVHEDAVEDGIARLAQVLRTMLAE